MWDFFIKNNKFAYLFLVALVGVGLYSLLSIPKESTPEVVIPVGVVSTALPGAPAADVESLVTNEIERGLVNLQNVKQITSVSREGFSNVTVEFEANADLDESILDLKDEVDALEAGLPDAAEEPTVGEVDFVNQPIMTIAISGDLSDFALSELANDVEEEIEAVSGVSRVEVDGVREREVAVIVNQESLHRYEVTLSDITNAIRNANLTVPIGQIVNEGVSYNVAFEGDIENTDQIKNIGIASRNGQPIYVKDVALVEDGLAAASRLSRLSADNNPSEKAASFDIYKQSGGDITKITADVNELITDLKQPGELLSDMTTVTVLDMGEDIQKDLFRLSASGLQTVVLVVLLLIATIGWREGLLAGSAIPLSFLFGFIGLYFSGNTINFLSLFSLILGIGILVDSAIVMVEGINRRMKDNPTIDKRQAAIETIRTFSTPLITGTLTTVSMFAGLLIVSGVIGQFIASIPFTLIFLLFASLFVALAIIPLIASSFLHRRNTSEFESKQIAYARKLENWYKGKLSNYLGHKDKEDRFLSLIFAGLVFAIFLAVNLFAGIIAFFLVYWVTQKSYQWQAKRNWGEFKRNLTWFPMMLASVVVSFLLASSVLPTYNPVEVIFFDQGDVDYVIVEVENPEGTTKEMTDIDVRRVEEVLYTENDIASFTTTVGSGSAWASGGTGEKFANIFINLKLDRERTSTEIVESLRAKTAELNDINVTVSQPSEGPPTGAAVTVKFLGDDLNEITDLANNSGLLLRDMENVVNVETSTNNNSTEFVIELDRDKAAALGVSPFAVSQLARAALYGSDATSLTSINEDIDVVVKLNVSNSESVTSDTTNETSINSLTDVTVPTASGNVPLSSLVSVSLRESSSVINHEDSTRVVSVSADVNENGNAREVQMRFLNKIEEELDVPSGVTVSSGGGETEESNQAFMEMFLALLVGVGLMVAILTLQFNSYLHMRYVLSILPYSLIGIMVGLALTQNALSFPSMMGFIALSGIVVNNSILLIDMMNQIRRGSPEMEIKDVVLEAASNRIRPILLTATTTVIGMIPLVVAGDLWAPLAYAVMFGLVFSVVITLVLIPILYSRNPGKLPKQLAR